MKTLYSILIAFVFLLMLPVLAVAQTAGAPTDLQSFFATFASLVAGIPLVVEFIKKLFNLTGRSLQIISWLIGVALAMFGWYFGLGFLAELQLWYHAGLYGVGASLAANGVADTKLVEKLFSLFIKKK